MISDLFYQLKLTIDELWDRITMKKSDYEAFEKTMMIIFITALVIIAYVSAIVFGADKEPIKCEEKKHYNNNWEIVSSNFGDVPRLRVNGGYLYATKKINGSMFTFIEEKTFCD